MNLQIIRITDKDRPIREMSTLEIYGAVAILTSLLEDWYEEMGCDRPEALMSKMDSDTYYCGKQLYINGGLILNDDEGVIKLTSVFCVEGSTSDLLGYAEIEVENEDGETEIKDIVVRI